MKLPNSYKDLTLKQYQEIHPLLKDEMQLDDWINILCKLSGLSYAEVESMPISKLKANLSQLSFLTKLPQSPAKKYIRKGFKVYKATLQAEELNTAQYTSIKTFCVDGKTVENLEKICACIYSELNLKGFKYNAEHFKESCEFFSNCKVSEVYGVVFFCSKALTYLMENTKDYLEAKRIVDNRMKEIVDMMREGTFSTFGVGMQQSMI